MQTMKVAIASLFILCLVGCRVGEEEALVDEFDYCPQVGDVYFQSLAGMGLPLLEAIEGATHSPYSHCGMLNRVDGEWMILEAIGPVKNTPLKEWTLRGKEGQYDVFRFAERYHPHIAAVVEEAGGFIGLPYDILYDFDDERIYCSELVFKAFKNACGEDLGQVVTLGDLDWKPFRETIVSIDPSLPLGREMITPKHMSEASQLNLVFRSIVD